MPHVASDPHAAILSLQRTVGNRAVANLIKQQEGSNATAAKVSLARVPEAGGEAAEATQKGPLWKQWRDRYQSYAASRSNVKEIEPYARAKAKELIKRAKDVEGRVTHRVYLAGVTRQGVTKGLEFRIKSEESLFRKIRDNAAKNALGALAPAKAVEQEGNEINDALRYTIILEPNVSYRHLFDEISETMKQYGYTPDLRKEFWGKSTTYKGINLTFRTPASWSADTPPLAFEVQLHTSESFKTKMANHLEYEKVREVGVSEEDKKVLNETMEDRWMSVRVPEGFVSVVPARYGPPANPPRRSPRARQGGGDRAVG